jgi:hypothetical protein|tara:strand:+ start:244 stop:378 length:135 start_codon:yes stop_codon:yes gene_type:complete
MSRKKGGILEPKQENQEKIKLFLKKINLNKKNNIKELKDDSDFR